LFAIEVNCVVAALWAKADVWKVDERRTNNCQLCRVRGSCGRKYAQAFGNGVLLRRQLFGAYDPDKFTAAHRTLPFGTRVRVTDTRSQRSVVVVVNDRGPFIKGRVIDLSLAAAKALRMTDRGLLKVTAVVE
jgi:Lytic transglycolase